MGKLFGKTRDTKSSVLTSIETIVMALLLCVSILAVSTVAQAPASQAAQETPDWQTAAGGKLAFDAASVKQNKSGLPPNGDKPKTNEPLGPGDLFYPSGGLFRVTNYPLYTYIMFAYKMSENQVKILSSEMPKWATSERFDIEARAEGNPTKDQMRLMMQSLLADRFKLKIHTETRQMPVYGLVLVRPGKTGPQLQPHPADASCSMTPPPTAAPGASAPPSPTVAGGFPATCGGFVALQPSVPGRVNYGARNSPIDILTVSLTGWANLDRPILNETGLSGRFDYHLEWTPQLDGPLPPGSTFQPDPTGPTFTEALREQFGVKLEPKTGPVDVFVVDHIEEPSPN